MANTLIPPGGEHNHYNVSSDSSLMNDTISIDSINTIDLSQYSFNFSNVGTTTAGSTLTGASGTSYTVSTGAGSNGTWGNTFSIGSMGSAGTYSTYDSGLRVDGDIKIKGVSLLQTLEAIQKRLAILEEPDLEKLEKFAALKKAYENYKLLDKLIGDDWKNEENDK